MGRPPVLRSPSGEKGAVEGANLDVIARSIRGSIYGSIHGATQLRNFHLSSLIESAPGRLERRNSRRESYRSACTPARQRGGPNGKQSIGVGCRGSRVSQPLVDAELREVQVPKLLVR